jgi:hypothetical protein
MPTGESGTVQALTSDLRAWIDRLFPDLDRGERLKRALAERFGNDTRAVTADVCREIEAVAHDYSRHFALEYVPTERSSPTPSRRAGRRRIRARSS